MLTSQKNKISIEAPKYKKLQLLPLKYKNTSKSLIKLENRL